LTASSGERFPAHEEEALLPDRRRAEVVGGGVDRFAEILRRPVWRGGACTVGDPDVEPTEPTGDESIESIVEDLKRRGQK